MKGRISFLHLHSSLVAEEEWIQFHGRRGEAASKGIHEDLGIALSQLMPLVNTAFFSLAGASLLLVRPSGHTGPAALPPLSTPMIL